MATRMHALYLILPVAAMLAFLCWRLLVGTEAATPLSEQLRLAANGAGARLSADVTDTDFAALERLFALAGALQHPSRSLALVRVYYSAVRRLRVILPFLAPWAEREMTVCARYVGAKVDQQLAINMACSRRFRLL